MRAAAGARSRGARRSGGRHHGAEHRRAEHADDTEDVPLRRHGQHEYAFMCRQLYTIYTLSPYCTILYLFRHYCCINLRIDIRQGVPRIKEILNVTKKIFTPLIEAPLWQDPTERQPKPDKITQVNETFDNGMKRTFISDLSKACYGDVVSNEISSTFIRLSLLYWNR